MASKSSGNRKRALRSATLLLATAVSTFVALLVSAAIANPAHAVIEALWTYRSTENCEQTRSEVNKQSNGNQQWMAQGRTYYAENFPFVGGYDCASGYDRPVNYKVARVDLYRWNSSLGRWTLCYGDNDWHYNPTLTYSYKFTWKSSSRAHCGTGYYGAYGSSFHYHGQSWYGGFNVWSGYDYFSR